MFSSFPTIKQIVVALSFAIAPPALAQVSAPPPTTAASAPSDEQLRRYIAVRDAIGTLTRGETFEEQRQNQIRIGQFLQANDLSADRYQSIDAQARTDATLRNRVAALSISGDISDEMLRNFAEASLQIAPIAASLSGATQAQRQIASARITTILAQSGLSSEAYNGIAVRAQSDADLAERIASAQLEIQRDDQS